MSITNLHSSNPFEIARARLIGALSRMQVPHAIGNFASASDFEAIGNHLRAASEIFDSWLTDIGHQVSDNAPCKLDMSVFDRAFSFAVDGQATFVCEEAAEAVTQSHREVA